MNNEDVIRILLNSNEYHHAKGDLPHSAASVEAFNKAIDALIAERPKGKWKHIIEEDNDVECPFCGFQEDGIYYNFCPQCGADMREGAENE